MDGFESNEQPRNPFADVDDAALAARVQRARDASEGLAQAALAASRADVEARAKFRSEPSPKTHADKAVAEQVAENARAAAEANAAELAACDDEITRRGDLARFHEIEPVADRDRFLAEALDEVAALASVLHAAMAAATNRMLARLDSQNRAAIQANRLAHELGMRREHLKAVPLPTLNEHLAEQLAKSLPPYHFRNPRGGGALTPPRFGVWLEDYGDGNVFVTLKAVERLSPSRSQ